MTVQQQFAPEPDSVPAARHFVLAQLSEIDPTVCDAVAIMVSELATNAVLHARTEFNVTVKVNGKLLRVDVTDRGDTMPRLRRRPTPNDEHGRGLRIVRELSDVWGIDGRAGKPGKSVWFQVATTPLAGA